jgi:ribose transport system substrate-binding protein
MVSVALMAVLAGCRGGKEEGGTTTSGGNSGGTSAGAPSGGTQKFVIGMSQCNLGEPWRVQMNADVEAAAKEHANEVEIKFVDAQNKSETQQAQVRDFIQQKVDLIIISPKESRPLTRPVGEAVDAGIPVIVLDRAIEGDKYTAFIGGDNKKIGLEAGKFINKILGGKGNVVELRGLMTTVPAHDRHDGFVEGLKGSQIQVVADPDCQWLEPNANREMKSILSTHPQIDLVYGHNDPSAHGAYMATRQEGKGREKQIKFVGIDALPTEGVKYVKDGLLTATFQYPTGGKEAIETALKILKKEPFEKKTTLGTRIFTKETADKGGEAL